MTFRIWDHYFFLHGPFHLSTQDLATLQARKRKEAPVLIDTDIQPTFLSHCQLKKTPQKKMICITFW